MVDALGYAVTLFMKWLGLFTAPIYHFEILWIILPIWISWIFTEFYQEKKSTSLGNAISNGVVPLWVGVDWGKTTYLALKTGEAALNAEFMIKMGLITFMIIYGLAIIVIGTKALKITKYVGRIREVTYFALVLTPIIYGVVSPTRDVILAIFLFFPVFYLIVELIDRIIPTPKIYEEDEGGLGKDFGSGETPDMGMPETQMPSMPQQQYPQQQYPQQQYPRQPQQQYPPGYPPQY